MIVEYGYYRHRTNSTGLTISSEVEETETGIPFRVNNTVNLEGKLRNYRLGNSESMDSTIGEMEAAYSVLGQNFGLLHDNGNRSASYWLNSNTIGGIRPKMLSYPNYQGGEYFSYRKFQISVQFATAFGATPTYLKFSETLSIEGGGPTFDVKEVNYGPGVRQRLRTHTKCTATQSGSAVGRFNFPKIPEPLWPHALRADPKISKVIRPRGGVRLRNVVREECEITWSYEYVWPTRLDGVPHYAIG